MRAMRKAIIFALLGGASCRGPESADLVVQAGRVHDVSGFGLSGDTIAVRDGAVAAVGAFAEIEDLIGEKTEVLRFPGAAILPGFEDAHIHLLGGGLSLFQIDLFEAETLDEIRERVRAFAEENPDEPWILGQGWKYTALPDGRPPTAFDLEGLAPGRPIFLTAYDGHSAWANREALELARIDRSTTVEGYGEIVTDARGEPTGMLKESAMRLVRRLLPQPTEERKLEALRRAMKRLASFGTVAIQNASGDEEELALYQKLLDRGELDLRVAMAMSIGSDTTDERLSWIAEVAAKNRGPWLKVTGVKIMGDGVIESHTAGMLSPYADAEHPGSPVYEQEALDSLVLRAYRAGLQVWIHAIGDKTVRMALDAYENALAAGGGPSDPRFRIEHIEVLHPDDVARFAKLGVIASMQPIHAYPSTVAVWSRAVGAERSRLAFPWEGLRSNGARLAFGTDWPASISVAPLRGIHNAVNRTTLEGEPEGGFVPEQRVSLEAAVSAFTAGGAFAAFDENTRGSLRPGQLADFIVLAPDPFDLPASRIHEAEPLLTVVGGRVTFRRNEP
jgi:predicted amidohydrolase YtcJ